MQDAPRVNDIALRERLDEGLADEVRSLLEAGLTAEQLKSYGLEYRHVTEYVCGEVSRERMFDSLSRAIQNFPDRVETGVN